MLRSDVLLDELRAQRVELATGVPCSDLAPWIDGLAASDLDSVPATNEGDAVAVAAGSSLGGRLALVYLQNSGLGNAVNPLSSLAWPYRTPMLLLISWRGEPGRGDEPQHELMGAATPSLLDALRIPWALLPQDEGQLAGVLGEARAYLEAERRPFALIARHAVLDGARRPATGPRPAPRSEQALPAAATTTARLPDRSARPPRALELEQVLALVVEARPDDVLPATTGFTGRALGALGDRPQQLAMCGSMGCVASLGLGLALARPRQRVVVLDGDGAFLMRLGALATPGRMRPPNLLHVLLDNQVHDSTGGQASLSPSVDAVGVAAACGYPRATTVRDGTDLERLLREPRQELTFVQVPTAPCADRRLPRPGLAPHLAASRLSAWLGAAS